MKDLKKELIEKINNRTISVAESITGGSFSSLLTSIPGASTFFRGGLVVYQTEIKELILNINTERGVVNPEVAKEMAINTKKYFKSDIAISFTGNAGPNPMEGKPIGLSYICIVIDDKINEFTFQSTSLDREEIIKETTVYGLKKLLSLI